MSREHRPASLGAEIASLLREPVWTTVRAPEAARGPLPLPPRIARRLAVAAGAAGGLTAIALGLPSGAADRLPLPRLGIVSGLLAATGVLAAPVIGQVVAATTGRSRVAVVLATVGTVASLALAALAIDVPFEGAIAPLVLIVVFGGLAWLAGTVAAMGFGTATTSTRVRRHRRLSSAALVVSAATLAAVLGGGILAGAVGLRPSGRIAAAGTVVGGGAIWGIVLSLVSLAGAARLDERDARRRGRRSETLAVDARLRFDCPGCGGPREHGRGIHRCSECGTRARVVIEEPRCLCGYPLFRLAGRHCPECGRTIAEAERYATARFEDDGAAEGPRDVPSGSSVAPGQSPAAAASPAPAEIDSETSDEPPGS